MKKTIIGLSAILLLAGCSGGGDQASTEDGGGSEGNNSGEQTTQQDQTAQTDNGENTSNAAVQELELSVLFNDGSEWEYDHDVDFETEVTQGEESTTGQEAVDQVNALYEAITVGADQTIADMKTAMINELGVTAEEVASMEFEAVNNQGEEISFSHDPAQSGEDKTVNEFELSFEFTDENEWDYEYDQESAEINQDNGESLEGQEARTQIEELLSTVTISTDSSINDMKQQIFDALGATAEDVHDFDLEITYADEEQITFTHDTSNVQ